MGTFKMPAAPGDSQKCLGLERLWFAIAYRPDEQLEAISPGIWVSMSSCLPHSDRLSWGHSRHRLAGKVTAPRCPSRGQWLRAQTGVISQLHHLIAVWPWTTYLTSLSLEVQGRNDSTHVSQEACNN